MTNLIDDVLCYGLGSAAAQAASHALLGRDPALPETWLELVARYAAGSGIVAATLTVYAVRRPRATPQEVAVVHWGVLLSCGAVVGLLHLTDYLNERKAARELDAAYAEEDRHVAGATPRRPKVPLPFRARG